MSFWLASKNANAFRHLTTPALARALSGVNPPGSNTSSLLPGYLLAAGAFFANTPAALAVLRPGSDQSVDILSIVVAKPFRRLGLARDLLRWIQVQALHLGWRSITVSYSLGQDSSKGMSCLIDSMPGWQCTEGLRVVRFSRDGGYALIRRMAPLVQRMHRTGRFSLLPWSSVTADVKQKLGEQLQPPPGFRPLSFDESTPIEQIDEDASTLMLDSGNPVGWLFAHRVGTTLFRVSRWWVVPAHQGKGDSLLMLDRAVRQSLSSQRVYLSGCFGIAPNNSIMLRLSRRHIESMGVAIHDHKRCFYTPPSQSS